MPASFITSLCGYRDGRPNTSDKNDKGSVELGKAFFEVMGVSPNAEPPEQPVGNLMAAAVAADLQQGLQFEAPHLSVVPERPFTSFEQFSHLNATRELRGDMATQVLHAAAALRKQTQKLDVAEAEREQIEIHLSRINDELHAAEGRRRELLDLLGEESLLKLDITVSREMPNALAPEAPLPHLVAGLSLKWSLRTDRAQDCRSQGAKMTALRRGRMPHFAAVTVEPRPAMLALLGRGSGDIDCVYHLNLPALGTAIDNYCSGSTRKTRLEIRDKFNRLRDQRRLRDYDELRSYLATL
ncbi:NgoMIV restriction enzyme [Streptomyces sp. 2224.1]|uniref:NgoMIV family type II restriction endonuclease n=1 Tax=Streptomyces sp. 2224.1 TaxID=1881020 RepID=UPI00089B5D1C|nr:NgoMIV family type II restriction endonuclease [Streptomyces sp. 2224.1]SEC10503.1 NgoMIV restriction enzyme [Streptomyces sp. 2224.1]